MVGPHDGRFSGLGDEGLAVGAKTCLLYYLLECREVHYGQVSK